MSQEVKVKLQSIVRSTTLRAVYVLLVIAALALAAGAPYAWGTTGP